MAGDKATQCKSCGKIYCIDCLTKYASHYIYSGKALFLNFQKDNHEI